MVNGVKLQQPAASRFWEKPCFGSCSSGLVRRVQWRGGGMLCWCLNYFFPKLSLFRQVRARRLPGKCPSPPASA